MQAWHNTCYAPLLFLHSLSTCFNPFIPLFPFLPRTPTLCPLISVKVSLLWLASLPLSLHTFLVISLPNISYTQPSHIKVLNSSPPLSHPATLISLAHLYLAFLSFALSLIHRSIFPLLKHFLRDFGFISVVWIPDLCFARHLCRSCSRDQWCGYFIKLFIFYFMLPALSLIPRLWVCLFFSVAGFSFF